MKYLLIYISVIFAFISCASEKNNEIKTPDFSSRDSLDWAGVYAGVLPCADCEGIQTKLTLTQDNTFGLEQTFSGKSSEPVKHYGSFKWSKDGTKIQLLRLEKRGGIIYFLVGEGQLIKLTSNAERYPVNIEKKYLLKKL